MKCPVCVQPDLVLADRQGVEIDYCPACRGVWLDRGELDKLIERSAAMMAPPPPAPPQFQQPNPDPYYRDRNRYRDDDDDDDDNRRGRRSWLADIFD